MSDRNWKNDAVQFPRLISEISAALDEGVLKDLIKDLSASMDCTVDTVCTLFDRAETAWETKKRELMSNNAHVDEKYTLDMWQSDINAGETELGYQEWQKSKIIEAAEAEEDSLTVCLYHHRHGTDVFLYGDPESAERGVVKRLLQDLGGVPNAKTRNDLRKLVREGRWGQFIIRYQEVTDELIDIEIGTPILRSISKPTLEEIGKDEPVPTAPKAESPHCRDCGDEISEKYVAMLNEKRVASGRPPVVDPVVCGGCLLREIEDVRDEVGEHD